MTANQDLQYDVFLSHSAKDKPAVRVPSLSASNGERAGVRCRFGIPLFAAIREIALPPAKPGREIGFHTIGKEATDGGTTKSKRK